ncbi:hypothetical protein AAVH_36930, partial [Aphelenchoides avenae]
MHTLSARQLHQLHMDLLGAKTALVPSRVLDVRHSMRVDRGAEHVALLKEQISSLTCQLETAQRRLLSALEQIEK